MPDDAPIAPTPPRQDRNSTGRHVLLVTMGAPGGIGRYERQLIDVLHTISHSHNIRLQVLQLGPKLEERRWPTYVFSAGGSKVRLLHAFLSVVSRHPRALVLFGHVNLAPLGLFAYLAPYMVCCYGIDVWYPLGAMRRLALRRAAGIISISSYTTEQLVAVQGVDRARIELLPPYYSLPDDRPAAPPDRAIPGLRLLSVTRLDEPEKGVDTVIRAMPGVREAFPSIAYVVIGEGNDLQRLRALAHEVGVEDCVHFRGFLADEELRAAYGDCDVFVLPSGKEGFGIVYLEAMAAGKPVVAARAGGVPDVVVDGETGLLVRYGDSQALCAAVRMLLADPDIGVRLGASGRRRVAGHFSVEQFTRRLERVLDLGGVSEPD